MFIRTTAINKILAMKARKKVVQGGTSAGKTYAIIPILIDRAAKKKNLKITVVAETVPAVKDGAVDIFKAVMKETGRWREAGWIGNPMEYTFANGSRIQFKSFEDEGKAKAAGKRDILFINEANHVSFQIADALMIRSKETYIDFNPDAPFWVHTEVIPEHNSEFISLTYEDNEACSEETIEDLLIKKAKAFFNPDLPKAELFKEENIKSNYWSNWWRVYGLGETGFIQGMILQGWIEFDELPEAEYQSAIGVDFGWEDPMTAIKVWVNHKEKKIYWKELFYASKAQEEDMHKTILNSPDYSKDNCLCDHSPRSVFAMRKSGLAAMNANKKNGITSDIRTIKQYELFIHKDSINLIFEANNWKWQKKGDQIIEYPDQTCMDHALDAGRYGTTFLIRT